MGWNRKEIGWGSVVINTWDWYRSLPAYTTTTTTTSTTTTTTTSTTTTTTTTTTTLAPAGWTVYGSTTTAVDSGGPPCMAPLSTDLIAFGTFGGVGGTIRTYSFGGTTWSQVGNALTTAYGSVMGLAKISATRVLASCSNGANNIFQMYDWDGTNWSTVGSATLVPYGNWAGLALISTTSGVHATDTDGNLQYITESGGTWSISGTTATASLGLNTGAPRMAYMGVGNRIAYCCQNQLACIEWTGAAWVVVGNILNTGGSLPSVAQYSLNSVTWSDAGFGTAPQVRKYDFDGTNWILQTGAANYSQAGITCVAMFESNKAVIGNNSTDNLINYQYS